MMKTSATKLIALLLALVMVLSLAACGDKKTTDTTPDSSTTNTPSTNNDTTSKVDTTKDSAVSGDEAPKAAKDTFVCNLTQDSGTLDPQFNIGWDCLGALRCVYEPLFDVTPDNEVVWVLATGIDMEPTKWIIHLREGVTFANGNEFDADDVVFTVHRACNRPGASSLLTRVLSDEENLKALDKYTVEVNFDRYDVGMETGTWPSIYMFDKESFSEDTVATETNGTGPYEMVKVVTNSQWVLERRDDYWGEAPAIRELTFNILSEATQRVNSLETGTADFTALASQDVEYCETMDDYDVIYRSKGYALSINFSVDPSSKFYDNIDARRAVAYAIDRQAVVDIAFGGHGAVSRLPVGMGKEDQQDEWLDMGFYGEGQNIEKAKQLAESSGLAGQTITLINSGTADSLATAELVQEDLRAIGVDVQVLTYDAGSWLTYIFDGTKFDMAVNSIMGDTVAGSISRANSTGGGMTYKKCEWRDSEEFQSLLTETVSNPDKEGRIAGTTRLLEIVEENMLWVALCDWYDGYAVNANVRGFDWSRSAMPTFWNLYWTE